MILLSLTDGELRPVSYTIISISSTTISLKWVAPDISNLIYPSFLQYQIFYNIAESTKDPLSTGRLSDTNFTLDNLMSSTRYKINIVAYSIYTTSPDNVQFIKTLKKSGKIKIKIKIKGFSPLVSIVPSITDRPVSSVTSSASSVMMSSTTITFIPSVAAINPSSNHTNQLKKLNKLVLFSCFRACTSINYCSKCSSVCCSDCGHYYYNESGHPPMLVD